MHEAYSAHSLLKLSYQVESIAAYDDNLLVGTRQGHLFMYSVSRSDEKCDVQLMRYNKSFSKKAVQQLEVIPDHNVLISLTDNLIQLHDINSITFTTICQVQKSKGATYFATNIQKQTSLTGDTSVLVCVAVVVKRKIQLYYLKNNDLLQLSDDINLSDIPRSVVWCQQTICVGYRGEYVLIEVNGGKTTDLFPTSSTRSNDPCIVRVSDGAFALCRESQTVLVNTKGETERNKALKWSDAPVTLAWDEPYALGVLSDTIEILTLEPTGVIQTLPDLQKVRFLVCARQGLLYAASLSQIWCIQAIDVAKQRRVLLDTKQFQLALKLTMISNESDEDKKEKIHHIHTLLAYDLFANKQFHDSMKEFLKLGTDPCDVIRLFPDLLPQQQGVADFPESSRDLTEKELETGLLALIDFLTEMRLRLQLEPQGNINARGNLNETAKGANKSTQQLLQIIDTTLLKCYLQTNDALVAPLLRRNHCHLAETEKILKKKNKHNELIILYQTKGQHRRALELMKSMDMKERAIQHLQHLDTENIALILEFAEWILEASPDEGLKIFTEDIADVEALPRPRVLDFLLKKHPSCAIPYLEHIVHVWKDPNSFFHNALIHQYREKIMKETLPFSDHTRTKLVKFLETSPHYTAENILTHFPTDDLFEERAIILGRLGKHDQSLAIYVRVLGDIEKAKTYCQKVYGGKQHGYQGVYVSLINLILNPDSCQLALGTSLSPKTAQPDLELALCLLEEYGTAMNPLEALSILPDNVPVSRLHKFLLVALHKVTQERRRKELMKGLLYAEHLQCQEMRLALQSRHVLVTDVNVCPVCKKRFGHQSALVRHPNGDVVHFSCHEKTH